MKHTRTVRGQRSGKRNVRMQTIKYIFRLLVTHFSIGYAFVLTRRRGKSLSRSEKKLTHAAAIAPFPLSFPARPAEPADPAQLQVLRLAPGNSSAIANKAFHFFGGKAHFLLLLSSKVMSTIALALLLTLGKWRPPAERLQPTFCPQLSASPASLLLMPSLPSIANILRPPCGCPVGVVGSLVYRSTYASLWRTVGHFSGHSCRSSFPFPCPDPDPMDNPEIVHSRCTENKYHKCVK